MGLTWWVDGEPIRARRAAGLPVDELVWEHAGLSPFALRLYENASPGAFRPWAPRVLHVARAIELAPTDLIGGDIAAFQRALAAAGCRF